MTTYTYSGLFQEWSDALDDWGNVSPTTLKIVTADDDDSFSYSKLPPQPGDDDEFPSAVLSGANPYNVWLDDAQVPFGGDVLIGQVAWGSGNVTYLMIIVNADDNDHLFQLGGDLLPTFNTLADFQAFEATISSDSEILTGAFAPGGTIDFASLPTVTITENDTINGDGAANELRGGAGRDRIFGADGNDKLYGDAGKDKLFGEVGNDRLYGGDLADKLVGGDGRDKLFGGGGGDDLAGGKGNDVLKGGTGSDGMTGGTGKDILLGQGGNDHLQGGAHSDVLEGGNGQDTLEGGKGNDTLEGGKDSDDLYGGGGSDVFLYSGSADEGDDAIFDFNGGVDTIQIGGGITLIDIDISGGDSTTVLMWNSTTVTLIDVDFATFATDDLLFL